MGIAWAWFDSSNHPVWLATPDLMGKALLEVRQEGCENTALGKSAGNEPDCHR